MPPLTTEQIICITIVTQGRKLIRLIWAVRVTFARFSDRNVFGAICTFKCALREFNIVFIVIIVIIPTIVSLHITDIILGQKTRDYERGKEQDGKTKIDRKKHHRENSMPFTSFSYSLTRMQNHEKPYKINAFEQPAQFT